jgi:hypothetical protein
MMAGIPVCNPQYVYARTKIGIVTYANQTLLMISSGNDHHTPVKVGKDRSSEVKLFLLTKDAGLGKG